CSASLWFLPIRRASLCNTGTEIPYALGTFTPKYAIFARTLGFASIFNSRRTAAQLHFPVRAGTLLLECLIRVEEDCDRPFIHQLHGHHPLENPRRYVDAERPQRRFEFFVQLLRLFRRRRGDETWPP